MTQTYSGRYIASEPQHGDNAEQRAWGDWLCKLVEYIRAKPDSRFIWRVTPSAAEESDFAANEKHTVVYGRLIEVIGPGELPRLNLKEAEESFAMTGFSLAQVKP